MSTKSGTATNYADLLDQLDGFLCATGHAWGLTFSGVGTGRLTNYLGTATSVTETITVTATSATSFSVVGSVSGALGTATVGTPFTSSVIGFTITAGGTAFVAGDFFRLNTGAKWERLRYGGCIEPLYRTANFSSHQLLFDDTTNITSSMITTTVFPATVTVQMFKATPVRAFSLWAGNSTTNTPRDFSLQWSDDGTSWTTAETWTGQTWASNYQRRDFITASAHGSHLYWRVNITAGNAATLNLSELRLWADTTMKWDVSSRFEFLWKAPGIDGLQEIFIAGYTYTDNTADTYNIAFRGLRYITDYGLSVVNMPNSSGDKFLPLSKLSTAYWIVVNGARFIVVARTSSVYGMAYCGFGLPYENPASHPFPLIVGAPSGINTNRWGVSSAVYRNPCDPGTNGTGGTLTVMLPGGDWLQVANRNTGTFPEGSDLPVGDTRGRTWPYSLSPTSSSVPDFLRDCLDGSKPLLPVVILRHSAPVHTWGEFDGVYWTTGFANSAEALIRDGAIDHLVVPNVSRSAINSFAAIALD